LNMETSLIDESQERKEGEMISMMSQSSSGTARQWKKSTMHSPSKSSSLEEAFNSPANSFFLTPPPKRSHVAPSYSKDEADVESPSGPANTANTEDYRYTANPLPSQVMSNGSMDMTANLASSSTTLQIKPWVSASSLFGSTFTSTESKSREPWPSQRGDMSSSQATKTPHSGTPLSAILARPAIPLQGDSTTFSKRQPLPTSMFPICMQRQTHTQGADLPMRPPPYDPNDQVLCLSHNLWTSKTKPCPLHTQSDPCHFHCRQFDIPANASMTVKTIPLPLGSLNKYRTSIQVTMPSNATSTVPLSLMSFLHDTIPTFSRTAPLTSNSTDNEEKKSEQ